MSLLIDKWAMLLFYLPVTWNWLLFFINMKENREKLNRYLLYFFLSTLRQFPKLYTNFFKQYIVHFPQ